MRYPDEDPIPETVLTWDLVLKRFAMPLAVPPEQLEARRRWSGVRVCRQCLEEKVISEEQCDFPFMKRGNGSFRHVCTDCRKTYETERRRKRPGPRKPYAEEMKAAPRVAALAVMEENPAALALLIKHFRKDFERLYREEVAAVERRESERVMKYQTRPQTFRPKSG